MNGPSPGQFFKLGYSSYDTYLQSAHWQRVRTRYRSDPGLPQECICGETKVHLHHRTYERLGREELTDLYPLCPPCHWNLHSLILQGLLPADANPEVLAAGERDPAAEAARERATAQAAADFAVPKPVHYLDQRAPRQFRESRSELEASINELCTSCGVPEDDFRARVRIREAVEAGWRRIDKRAA